MQPSRFAFAALTAIAALSLSACEKKAEPAKPAAAAAATLPADLIASAEPADAKGVKEAKDAAKEGDTVVVRGRIGGSEEPFVDGRAVFTIVDASLKSCADEGDDHCATPWDYCCEPRDNLTVNSATVQVVDPSGAPLKAGLKEQHGLTGLADVIVVGTVSKKDDAGTFVINARSIFVAPAKAG